MKTLIMLTLLTTSTLSFAQTKSCNLSANNRAIEALNQRFNSGNMSGEDHLIGLMELHEERMETIKECLENDKVKGITKAELEEVKVFIEEEMNDKVEAFNNDIRLSLENDRVGMATQTMMERDIFVLETKNLIAKIDGIIARLASV